MNKLQDPKYWLQLLIPKRKSNNRTSHTKYSSPYQRESISDNSIFPGELSHHGTTMLSRCYNQYKI